MEVDDLEYGNRYITQPNKAVVHKRKRNLSQIYTPKINKFDQNIYGDSDESFRNGY